MVIGGGLSEIGVSLFLLIAFRSAFEYHVNAGIASVPAPMSSVFVTIVAYCRYGEELHYMYIFGLVIVITGAIVITFYPPETLDGTETTTTSQTCIVLGLGFMSAMSLTTQILFAKALADRGADGRLIGLNFMVPSGIIGTIGLIILTCTGSGLFALGLEGTLLMILASITGTAAIALLQYAISIGIIGVVSAIYNTNPAWLTLFCFLFFHEAISI